MDSCINSQSRKIAGVDLKIWESPEEEVSADFNGRKTAGFKGRVYTHSGGEGGLADDDFVHLDSRNCREASWHQLFKQTELIMQIKPTEVKKPCERKVLENCCASLLPSSPNAGDDSGSHTGAVDRLSTEPFYLYSPDSKDDREQIEEMVQREQTEEMGQKRKIEEMVQTEKILVNTLKQLSEFGENDKEHYKKLGEVIIMLRSDIVKQTADYFNMSVVINSDHPELFGSSHSSLFNNNLLMVGTKEQVEDQLKRDISRRNVCYDLQMQWGGGMKSLGTSDYTCYERLKKLEGQEEQKEQAIDSLYNRCIEDVEAFSNQYPDQKEFLYRFILSILHQGGYAPTIAVINAKIIELCDAVEGVTEVFHPMIVQDWKNPKWEIKVLPSKNIKFTLSAGIPIKATMMSTAKDVHFKDLDTTATFEYDTKVNGGSVLEKSFEIKIEDITK